MGKLLDDFLLEKSTNLDTIPKGLYNKLIKVELEICNRKSNIEAAHEIIKNNSINIKSIAEATQISRKTFYNNQLLNDIVIENNTGNDVSKEELKKVKAQMKESEAKIKKLVAKDIDIEELKATISELEKNLYLANERIKLLEDQIEKNCSKTSQNVYHIKIN